MLNINIPRKVNEGPKNVSIQCKISGVKSEKFEVVKDVLGGYTNQEIMELVINQLIAAYYPKEDSNEKETE